MEGGVEQPWQIVVGRDTAQQPTPPVGAFYNRGEHADVQRDMHVDQSLPDTLFDQLLEPLESSSNKLHAATNAVLPHEAQDGDLPWMVSDCLSTKHPKDPEAADTTTPESTGPPSAKTTTGDQINSGNRTRPASVLDRPRLRAPRGDPSKKHKCPVQGCSYSANGTGHLYRHMLTHNGRKDHKCTWPGCKYASNQAAHLRAHMRKHSGERPYSCPVAGCDYSCARSWHVTRHMEKQHPEEVAKGARALASLSREGGSSSKPTFAHPPRPARGPVKQEHQVSRPRADAAGRPPEKRARVWDALLQRTVDADEFTLA